MEQKPRGLPVRTDTLRNELRDALQTGQQTVRELSQKVGAAERELYEHLEHLARSLPHAGQRLTIEPARCLGCGFEFEERTRFKKPGRCPTCKSTRIAPPRVGIESE
jgi:predicted Zn-ribbon and HTH transcriptional regulator